jgi:SAM-dependent methyltransferase
VESQWARIRRDPIGTTKRAWNKLVLGRFKYGKKGDYDASRYWHDRFARSGRSLQGAGDEGLSQTDNEREYEIARQTFRKLVESNDIDFAVGRTLEVGCGTGFYTRQIVDLGSREFVAYDITDVLFPELRAELPQGEFRKADVTETPIDGTFDRGVMIDVLQHVVNDDRFVQAVQNVAGALKPDAPFLVGPVPAQKVHGRDMYYLKFRVVDDALAALPEWKIAEQVTFRDGDLLVLRRR